MKKYFFVSNEYHAGKTSLILGLGLLLKEKRKTLGYYKPWSILSEKNKNNELIDPNLFLIKNTLGLKEDLSELFGVALPPNYMSEFLSLGTKSIWNSISKVYDNLSKKDFDYLFIEGHGYPYFGQFLDVSHERIANHSESTPIIVAGMNKLDKDRILDSIISTKSVFKDFGHIYCILNKIPPDYPQSELELIQDQLKSRNISLIGSVPNSKILANPTVKDIFHRVQGEVIISPSENNETNIVQDFLIGAMDVQAALPYLRKTPSKAVITGGDRSDLILAALETDTELLILTGTNYPESKVLLRARKSNVPILKVPYDTHTVVQLLDSITWLTPPDNKIKIDEVKKLTKKHIDMTDIF